jgi:FAD/FMN-containing dehydrogenase
LGADQVLEYKVVVADGRLVVANPVSNPDLFWALRGGGPSTFGIVVEATVKAYPSPKILSYSLWMNTSTYDDTKSIWAPAAYLCSQLPRLNREYGFQGYFTFYKNALSANWLIPNEFANVTRIKEGFDPVVKKMSEMPGIDKKTVVDRPPREISQQALGGLQSSGGGAPAISGNGMKGMEGMNYETVLRKRHGPGEMTATVRGLVDMDSRLLGEAELTHERFADALEKAIPKLPNGQLRSHLTAGKQPTLTRIQTNSM